MKHSSDRNLKLCLYFNIPSLYREVIYRCINNRYKCSWHFEDIKGAVKYFDTRVLDDVKVHHVYKIGPFEWTSRLLSLLFEKHDIYIFIGSTRNVSLFIFLLFKKFFFPHKKVVLWSHGYYGKESWMELSFLKRPLFRMADSLLLYGNFARDLMIKDGFSSKRLYAIHNSLSYPEQLSIRKSLKRTAIFDNHFKNDYPVLIFIGRLTPVKRIDIFLDAIRMLRDKKYYYNVVLVGDGVERDNLKNKVDKLGIDSHVWLYGESYNEKENGELIYNSDLCVAPGNVGLTAIHSLMFGCPVITHDDFKWQMPEFEAISAGITGDFFKRDDVNSLVDSIIHWFSKNKDRREIVRQDCYKEIDTQWNPNFQMNVISRMINETCS
jgi:glycosyltransferase involved in cell wall biosynthesis